MIVRPDVRCDASSSAGDSSAPERRFSSREDRTAFRMEAATRRAESSQRVESARKADLKFQLARTKTGLWQVLDASFACGGVFQDRVSATRFIRQELAGCSAPIVYVLIGSAE